MTIQNEPPPPAGTLPPQRHPGALVAAVLTFLVVFGVSAYFILTTPYYYTSRATFYVRQKGGIGGDVGELIGLGPGSGSMDRYFLALLQSRTMLSRVASKLELMNNAEFWFKSGLKQEDHNMDGLSLQMHRLLDVNFQKGIMSIQAVTTSPKLSSDLVNTYLDLLGTVTGKQTGSVEHNVSAQIQQKTEHITELEGKLQALLSAHGPDIDVSVAGGKGGGVNYGLQGELQRELSARRAELAGLSKESEGPGDLLAKLEMKSRTNAVQAQVERLNAELGSVKKSAGEIPSAMVQMLEVRRALEIDEQTLKIYYRKLEEARLTQTDIEPDYWVIDRGITPERHDPRMGAIKLSLAALAGLILGYCVWRFILIVTRR